MNPTRLNVTPPNPTRGRASRRTGLLLAFGTACISGVAVFLNAYGVKAFGDASTYTTAKNVVAAVVLVLLTGAMSARRPGSVLTRPSRPRQWAGLAVVGVFGGAVAFLLFFEGLARASSTDAAFLHKTLLVWVALLALPLLGERLGAMHVAAIALLVTLLMLAAATLERWGTAYGEPWAYRDALRLEPWRLSASTSRVRGSSPDFRSAG